MDNYEREEYDFNRMLNEIAERLPAIKKEAFVLSIRSLGKEIIDKKVQYLKKSAWRCAWFSSFVAAVPVPGISTVFDLGIAAKMEVFYQRQLCLDRPSLEKIGRTNGLSMDDIKAAIPTAVGFSSLQYVKLAAQLIPWIAAEEVAEESLKFIPILGVVGSFIAAPLSFAATYALLSKMIDLKAASAFELWNLIAQTKK